MKKSSKPLRNQIPKLQGSYRSSRSQDIYPSVDPTKLTASATESLEMANQLTLLLKHIKESRAFASQLMDAAQRGNRAEVDRLVKSTGMNRDYSIKYNPQGFHLELKHAEEDHPCCKVEITLYWSN